ncbi:hypothetical protein M2271_007406 [Streptomyces sp. LBL]|nr:hypothetical protein [Streptomyces sp. LBL]
MATATAIRAAREYLRVSKGKGKAARSITDQHRDNLTAEEEHGPWTWGEAYKDTGSASKFATKIRDDFEKLLSDLETGAFGRPGDVLVVLSEPGHEPFARAGPQMQHQGRHGGGPGGGYRPDGGPQLRGPVAQERDHRRYQYPEPDAVLAQGPHDVQAPLRDDRARGGVRTDEMGSGEGHSYKGGDDDCKVVAPHPHEPQKPPHR